MSTCQLIRKHSRAKILQPIIITIYCPEGRGGRNVSILRVWAPLIWLDPNVQTGWGVQGHAVWRRSQRHFKTFWQGSYLGEKKNALLLCPIDTALQKNSTFFFLTPVVLLLHLSPSFLHPTFFFPPPPTLSLASVPIFSSPPAAMLQKDSLNCFFISIAGFSSCPKSSSAIHWELFNQGIRSLAWIWCLGNRYTGRTGSSLSAAVAQQMATPTAG